MNSTLEAYMAGAHQFGYDDATGALTYSFIGVWLGGMEDTDDYVAMIKDTRAMLSTRLAIHCRTH